MTQLGVAIVDPERSTGEAQPVVDHQPTLATVPFGDPSGLARWIAERPDLTHVSVLSRPERASSARLLATIATGQHPDVAITVLVRDVAHVALGSVAVSVLDWHGPPGASQDHLRQILDGTVSGAVLRSVTRLSSPKPSFWQHLKSLWPGKSRFVVYHGSGPGVVDASRLPTAHPEGTGSMVAAAVTREDFTALEGLMQRQVVRATPLGGTEVVYGHPATEFAQMGVSTREPAQPCPVCRELTSAPTCPFCRSIVLRKGVPTQ